MMIVLLRPVPGGGRGGGFKQIFLPAPLPLQLEVHFGGSNLKVVCLGF